MLSINVEGITDEQTSICATVIREDSANLLSKFM